MPLYRRRASAGVTVIEPREETSQSSNDALGASVGRAASIVIASILASRLLGFVRQAAINAEFGVEAEADAWFAAFRIPDSIFMLLAGGALLSAVIPVYAEVRARGDRQALARFVGRIGGLVAAATAIAAGLGALFADPLMRLVAPGFSEPTVALAADAARWLMISPVILGVSAVAKSALQAERAFTLPALSPVLYNLGIIAGALGLARVFGLTGLVWGTLIGTGLHLLVQTPGLPAILAARDAKTRWSEFMTWHPGAALADPDVRKVIRLMVPRMLGVAVLQASLVYINILASLQGPSAVAVLNNAFLLMLLPLGVFAMALGEAALPDLAHRWISGDRVAFARRVRGVGRHVLFLSVPAAVVLAVLAEPIVTVAFERGDFDCPRHRAHSRRAAVLCRGPCRSRGSRGAGAWVLRHARHAHAGGRRRSFAGAAYGAVVGSLTEHGERGHRPGAVDRRARRGGGLGGRPPPSRRRCHPRRRRALADEHRAGGGADGSRDRRIAARDLAGGRRSGGGRLAGGLPRDGDGGVRGRRSPHAQPRAR